MKKNYIIPSLQPMDMDLERIVAGSITSINGAGIGVAPKGEEIPTTANANANPFGESIFD